MVVAVYLSAGLAGSLAGFLRREGLLQITFGVAFLATAIAVVGISLGSRPRGREVWVVVGVVAVCAVAVVRLGIGPAERTHLFEYGLLAILIGEALHERREGRGGLAAPVGAVVLATLVGWGDEAIQSLLPGRVYDLRDVGINAIAAAGATLAGLVLRAARARLAPGRPPGST